MLRFFKKIIFKNFKSTKKIQQNISDFDFLVVHLKNILEMKTGWLFKNQKIRYYYLVLRVQQSKRFRGFVTMRSIVPFKTIPAELVNINRTEQN
jgi:hypothetical protein